MAYDYREAVKDDVLEYINNEINFEDFDTLEELEEHLNEVLFTEDSVTGNASGSYTFNTTKQKKIFVTTSIYSGKLSRSSAAVVTFLKTAQKPQT